MDLAAPVFEGVAAGVGHYESYFLRAADPAGGRAVWLRHTVHQRPGQPRSGAVWCTVFDPGAGRPATAKARVGVAQVAALGPGSVRVGDATLTTTTASGAVAGRAGWELELSGDEPLFAHLPAGWLYRAPLPRTKAVSLRPSLTLRGWVEIDGRRTDVDGWPGMVGHNWGAEHAHRWIWLHAAGFAERPDDWVDLTLGRIRVAGRTLPWIANGCLSVGGVRHRLGGLRRRALVTESPTRASIALPGLRLTVAPPRDEIVVWRYADPAGPEHHVAHASAAPLTVEHAGERLSTLAAAYELGMAEHDHGLPVEEPADP